MSNPQEQYRNLFGESARHADHSVGDTVMVPGSGECEIVHIVEATQEHGLQYVVHDGQDFPFTVNAGQVSEIQS